MAMLIYIVVFLAVSIAYTRVSPTYKNFQNVKSLVAFINYDGDTPLTNGLKTYLAGSASFVDVKTDTKSLQDAVYFRTVEYIIKIPKGFTQKFLNGENIKN